MEELICSLWEAAVRPSAEAELKRSENSGEMVGYSGLWWRGWRAMEELPVLSLVSL